MQVILNNLLHLKTKRNQSPKGGGGITDQIEAEDQTGTFGYGGRHLNGTKLNMHRVPEDKINIGTYYPVPK